MQDLLVALFFHARAPQHQADEVGDVGGLMWLAISATADAHGLRLARLDAAGKVERLGRGEAQGLGKNGPKQHLSLCFRANLAKLPKSQIVSLAHRSSAQGVS